MEGIGFYDGPRPSQNEMTTMRTWSINAVRIPLNEDCWLGINYNANNQQYFGTPYQNTIKDFVYTYLIPNGITPILDLQFTAPGTVPATGLEMLPDYDHSANFWSSVVGMFGGDDRIIFDAFNEPDPPNEGNYDPATWSCWRDGQDGPAPNTCAQQVPNPGGCLTTGNYPTPFYYHCVGMQEMVTAIRSAVVQAPYTQPDNIIILGGANYSKEFNHWGDATVLPNDPYHNLAMSGHTYCSNCGGNPTSPPHYFEWDQDSILQWLNQYPIVAGEIGEYDQEGTYIDTVMAFLDNPSAPLNTIPAQSYLVWHWNAQRDAADLIQNWDTFTPTCYGQYYYNYLQGYKQPSCHI